MNRTADPVETDELCSYGCGNVANYKNGSGNLMCEDRSNKCPAIKKKNSLGGQRSYSTGKRPPASEAYLNLPQETKDRMSWNRGKFTGTVFEYGGKGSHKKVLIEERGHQCECCGLGYWLDKPITLELEHIDGDNKNNIKTNLKLLCPNCHSQTGTWKGRNINSDRMLNKKFVSDQEFLDAINTTLNVRQALIKLGLTPKAANYKRAYELKFGGRGEIGKHI
jgi:Zn finger protein HypA/HybF involved in hydrogenase expression